jgi:stress response protein SCP2
LNYHTQKGIFDMTATLTQGANMVLPQGPLTVRIEHHASVRTDMVALLLNSEGKVRSDDDLIFFNNPAGQGARWSEPSIEGDYQHHSIQIDPTQWDTSSGIAKLLVALTIDETTNKGKSFGDVRQLQVEIFDNSNNLVATLDLGRPTTETGFLIAQIYLHNGTPKVRCIAQGYTTGLTGIVTDHGIEVADEEPSVQAVQPVVQDVKPEQKLDMTKRPSVSEETVAAQAPGLVSFHKQVISFAKDNNVLGERAAVYSLFDHSGSMEFPENQFYSRGLVQYYGECGLSIALTFDDDGKIPTAKFDGRTFPLSDVTMANYSDFAQRLWTPWDMGGTDFVGPMESIIEAHGSKGLGFCKIYTDGDPRNKRGVKLLIKEAHRRKIPIFWQFVLLGDGPFTFVDDLNGLTKNPDTVGVCKVGHSRLQESALVPLLLNEFPTFIRSARANLWIP